MKKFEEYQDGEWVYYQRNYFDDTFKFQAYKSKHTHNAFRLRNTHREVIADISEIEPMGVSLYENPNPNIQQDDRLPRGYSQSYVDCDAPGFYYVQD